MNTRLTSCQNDQMASIFGSQNGQTAAEETPLQGLFLDIVGCMDRSKNKMTGRKSKPMTGFSQILNMITETMVARASNCSSSQQSASSSEPRIHEIFQQSSSLLMGNTQVPCTAPVNISKRQEPTSCQHIYPPQSAEKEFLIQSSNHVRVKGLSSHPPSRIPIRQNTPSCQNIPHAAQKGSVQLSVPEQKKTSYFGSDGRTNAKASLDSFPQEIADALKNYNQAGLPTNVNEIEAVLKKAGYTPPSQNVISPPPPVAEADESSIEISADAVTHILDNIVGVAYHCCGERVSGACRYCFALCVDDVVSDTTIDTVSEGSLQPEKSSDYYDCCTGDESGDDGRLWSSGPESECGARDAL